MINSTSRKVGNSIMITIPKELHPKSGQEYLFKKTENGTIIMAPKIANPFLSDEKYVIIKQILDYALELD